MESISRTTSAGSAIHGQRPLEQKQGWAWQSVHDPDMLPKVLEGGKAQSRPGKSFGHGISAARSGWEFRMFLTRVSPVKDAEGRVVRLGSVRIQTSANANGRSSDSRDKRRNWPPDGGTGRLADGPGDSDTRASVGAGQHWRKA